MTDTRYPNRWFGSNPPAIPNQGKKLSAFPRDLPKDWRSAVGLSEADATPDDASEAPGSE